MITNPNPVDNGLVTKRSGDLCDVIYDMWEAGSSVEGIADDVALAIESATGVEVRVEVSLRGVE